MRLFGWGADERDDTWRHLTSCCFADDWLGTFHSAQEAKAAWALWRAWEPITGCKLGIKKQSKTVLTGVHWVDGKAQALPDLELTTVDGRRVPFMQPHEAYKHLGVWRRADGDESTAWKELLKKFEAALARLRRFNAHLYPAEDFVLVSEALLGGLAGYYLRSLYITRAQAEVVECKWRAIYNFKYGRATSAPRATLYGGSGTGRARLGLWGVGLAALFDSMYTALADAHDSSQSRAVASALARAASTWGCRQDPTTWQYSHLLEEMENWLNSSPMRDLGVAWWLAAGLLNSADEAGKGRLRPWRELEAGHPLRADAVHFKPERSVAMFDPVELGGLGAPPRAELITSGCVAAEHFITRSGLGTVGWASPDGLHRVDLGGCAEGVRKRGVLCGVGQHHCVGGGGGAHPVGRAPQAHTYFNVVSGRLHAHGYRGGNGFGRSGVCGGR